MHITTNGRKYLFDPEGVESFSYHSAAIRVGLENKYATFITTDFINSIMEKDKRTGENLEGSYFAMAYNMVITKDLYPETVGKVIDDLIDKKELDYYFS